MLQMTSSLTEPSRLDTAMTLLKARNSLQFLVLLVLALLFRFPTFGEWNYAIDDQYYALVGHRILEGDLLYVDIWDRKPPTLYLTFSLIGLISRSVIAYQIVALISVALGAYGVNRLAARLLPSLPALLAGVIYLALMNRFEGDNAEAGVFFNTLVIAAACLIAAHLDDLRQGRITWQVVLAFFCCGVALTYKQSTIFEGVGIGLFVTFILLRSKCGIVATLVQSGVLALVAALPMVITGLWFFAIGHFAEFWTATVESNFSRGYADPIVRVEGLLIMSGMLGIPFLLAVLARHAVRQHAMVSTERRDVLLLICAWLSAAVIGLVSFPNIYIHYAQTVLPPLAIVSAAYFVDRKVIWPGLIALIGVNLALSGAFHLKDRWRARAAAAEMVDYIRLETPDRNMFVWGSPNYLYAIIGSTPPRPLAFAPHMYEGREWTGIDPAATLRTVLDARPSTVVSQFPIPVAPLNHTTVAMVDAYVKNCRRQRQFVIYDHNGSQRQTVFSQCGQD